MRIGVLFLALGVGGMAVAEVPRGQPPQLPFDLASVAPSVSSSGCTPVSEHDLINPLNQRYNALGWVLNPGDAAAEVEYACRIGEPVIRRGGQPYQALLHFKCVVYSGVPVPRLRVRILGPDGTPVAREVFQATGDFQWASLSVRDTGPGVYRLQVQILGSSYCVGWISNCAYFVPEPWEGYMASQWVSCYGLVGPIERIPLTGMSRDVSLVAASAFSRVQSGRNAVGWEFFGPEAHSYRVQWDLPREGGEPPGQTGGGSAPGQVGAPAPGPSTQVRAGARHSPAGLPAGPQSARIGILAWWPHGRGEVRVTSPGGQALLEAPIFPSPEVRTLWWPVVFPEAGTYSVVVADEGIGSAQALIFRDLVVAAAP